MEVEVATRFWQRVGVELLRGNYRAFSRRVLGRVAGEGVGGGEAAKECRVERGNTVIARLEERGSLQLNLAVRGCALCPSRTRLERSNRWWMLNLILK